MLQEYDLTQSHFFDNKTLRTRKAAKHLLAAIIFNESSTAFLTETEGTLLATIGYYYVGFHISIAMLSLCPEITSEHLTKLHHKQLKKLIEQHLLQSKQINRSFLNDYNELQEYREYANYDFGSKFTKEDLYYPLIIHSEIKNRADRILFTGKGFIINQLEELNIPLLDLQVIIGDDIGSDLIRLHAGKNVDDNVWSYLVANELTT